jgi:alpha-amylase/alpha-mannosidase (GH57 family)
MMQVCFLWHMHQPDYRDAVSGEALMPWVRLHATRGYYDMAKMLAIASGVCVTVNFAPSLLEQLRSLQDDKPDRFTALAYRDAESLSFSERCLLLRHFFSVSRENGVNPRPRYLYLLQKRDETSIEEAALRFSVQELRDLAALFYLSWVGWAAREEYPRLTALESKGESFTEEEKREILSLGDSVAKQILPLYRALQEQKRVELSATPYAHPILPLICDTDSAKVARPDLPVPTRFSFPQDAVWHVREAKRIYQECFSADPLGMWPAEGSISPQVIPIFEEAGLRWIASDEGVLLRSLDGAVSREDAMTLPWRLVGSSLDLVFRDRDLSDRIGFWYSKMSADDAANDFLTQVKQIEAKLPPNESRMLCIILDGENPWENYPDSGRGFLSRVYHGLAGRCVGLSQSLSRGDLRRGALSSLHSGSWIEASFRIWIGGEADNRAWELLRETRVALENERERATPEAIMTAERHMYIAEGSDWFWWFGDDFGSQEKRFFDALFRGRLLAVYRALQQEPPAALLSPVEEQLRTGEVRAPSSNISPKLDGLHSSLTQWRGAGEVLIGYGRSAMHSGVEPLERLLFARAGELLYLRLHLSDAWHPDFSVILCSGEVEVSLSASEVTVEFIRREVLEVCLRGGAPFFLEVRRGSYVISRYPTQGHV